MIHRLLDDKRLGRAHSAAEIQAFIQGVLDGSITRAQAAAWLAFVCCRGMTRDETVALTQAMTDSGDKLTWDGLTGPIIDKHSTGGVGDKVSLILAPVWVVMGMKVPMISGRGLGLTGGTLDKLEAIEGYNTRLPTDALRRQLEDVGCFICGQTDRLAPADRVIYALRDETGTVPSVPLITASILSKKLAEGIERLVLDVKVGSGAFMKSEEDARALAESLAAVGRGAGLVVDVHLTDMSQPLGEAVGNALEVEESIRCLRGEGPDDLHALVCQLSGDPERADAVLRSGAALPVFERMVAAQGGDLGAPLKGGGCEETVIRAEVAGEVTRCDAEELGLAAFVLGAGRVKASDDVHFGVGLRVHKKRGARVEVGEPLVTLVHAGDRGLAPARRHAQAAFTVRPG
ncbi:MAG: Pyrimidine-nucleoside phosphorylase [Pseudomonadota bacterium]